MKKNKNDLLKAILFFIFLFFAFAFICVIFYVRRNFVLIGTNPIAQILFHCIVQIDGADPTFIKGIIKHCIIIPMAGSLIATLFVYGNFPFLKKIHNLGIFSFVKKHGVLISALCMLCSMLLIGNELKVIDYINTYGVG